MNKKLFAFFFLILNLCLLHADEYFYPDVEDYYTGVYVPVVFDNYLKNTKLFYESMAVNARNQHTVLFLGKNRCNSEVRFHGHYAIRSKEFKNFRFITNDNGIFCIDSKGNSYKKISDTLNESGDGYNAFENYVLNELFDFAKDMKNVEICDFIVKIDGEIYQIVLDGMFFETKNVAAWLIGKNRMLYALVKNGYNGELHSVCKGNTEFFDDAYVPKDEIIKEFPLMFIPTNIELPWSNSLPKEQLRYLRNLVYAKHGYIFKSEDLKNYFENFSWYRPNPKFSEDDFSREEKIFIKSVQNCENRK